MSACVLTVVLKVSTSCGNKEIGFHFYKERLRHVPETAGLRMEKVYAGGKMCVAGRLFLTVPAPAHTSFSK